MVDSGEWVEVHGAMVHRYVVGGRFGGARSHQQQATSGQHQGYLKDSSVLSHDTGGVQDSYGAGTGQA